MSTLKKVLSLVLCISLLAGSFTMLGGLTTVASAAETPSTHTIKSYADLCKDYDHFVYFGTEVREIEVDAAGNVTADNGLTDGYVQPGQWLEYRAHIKSDMWVSTIVTGIQFDKRFFDAHATAKPVASESYDVGAVGTMNDEHPMTSERGISVKYTVKPAANQNQFSGGYTKLDAATYANLDDAWQTTAYDVNVSTLASDISTDTWLYKFYAKVLDEPTVTEAKSYTEPSTWKISPNASGTQGTPQVNSNLATGALLSELADAPARSTCKNMNLTTTNGVGARFGVVTVLLTDADYTFVLGDPPAAAPTFVATFKNGETVISEAEYEAEAEIAVPEAPAAEAGYVFAGWAVEGTTDIVTAFVMGEADVTYVAIFEALPAQTATFMNGADVYDTFEIYAGGKIVAPAGPAGENGSNFLYWSTSEDGDAVADWTMPEGGATFYAVFSAAAVHAVKYVVNGAETVVNVVEGSEYTIAGAPEFDATAYRFLGWANAAGEIVSGTQTMGTEDVTYTALFEEIVYYTVTYYVDGAADGEAAKYEENTKYIVKTDAPAKTGYTFAGWSTVDGDATAIIGGEQTITADVALYAVYTVNKYSATFNAGNGAAFEDGTTSYTYAVDYNDYIVAPATAPAKAGYTFKGWKNYTEGMKMGAADKTFAAEWTANTYKATFYLDADTYAAGEALKAIDATYDKALNTGYSVADLTSKKTGYKFAGWADAATGEIATGSMVTNANLTKYAYDSDKAFYALWTKYDSSITLMVRDYANGEGWTTYATMFADNGATYNLAGLKGKDVAAAMGWDNLNVAVSRIKAAYTSEDCNAYADDTITYDGDKVFYLFTEAKVDVSFVSGDVTQTINATTTPDSPYTVTVLTSSVTVDTTPATGYKFGGWKNASGETVSAVAGKGYVLNVKDGAAQTLTADFQAIEYKLVFNVNNSEGYSAIKTADATFSIGDTINLAAIKYVDANGNSTLLPTIGAENGAQTGGDLTGDDASYTNKNGWKFVGWMIGVGSKETSFAIDKTYTVDEEFIKAYAAGETIKITGVWEALPGKLEFYVATGFNDDGTEIYELLESYDVLTGDAIATYRTAATAKARENAPEGKTFITWDDTTTVNMPAGGLKLYAKYQSESVKVYLDYNNSTDEAPLTIEERVKEGTFYNAYYGLDIMGKYPDGSDPLYDQVRRMTITNTPGENYACIGWDVYTIESEDDLYKEENWTKVELGDSYKAEGILIFKANWKAYGDFFVRLYDTNHKMIKALGKDFKMYYWASGVATDKAGVDPVNHAPDGLVIVLYILKLETSGGLSLVIEPFAVNKTFFDITNIGALFEALGGLLGNLL